MHANSNLLEEEMYQILEKCGHVFFVLCPSKNKNSTLKIEIGLDHYAPNKISLEVIQLAILSWNCEVT